MKRNRPFALFVLLCLSLALGGCPMGYRQGADAETSVRGATQAADLPTYMPQTTAGMGGMHGHVEEAEGAGDHGSGETAPPSTTGEGGH